MMAALCQQKSWNVSTSEHQYMGLQSILLSVKDLLYLLRSVKESLAWLRWLSDLPLCFCLSAASCSDSPASC